MLTGPGVVCPLEGDLYLVRREAEPGVTFFANYSVVVAVGTLGLHGPQPQHEVGSVGDFLHGEAVNARFGQVRSAAVPHLHGAKAHTFVQEGVIRIGGGGAYLLGLDEFRGLFKQVSQAEMEEISIVADGRLHVGFLPVGGVPKVFTLGVVDAFEGHLH